jgi:hypothetical protein
MAASQVGASMNDKSPGAPSWLFSFVDLAFLMLIAMTQLAPDPSQQAPDLGEMIVPRISEKSSGEMPKEAARSWQLRVHPPSELESERFELVLVDPTEAPSSEFYAEVGGLRERLAELERISGPRPLLAPHEDSRSQDLLDAAALLEEFWPGRRRVTVARVFDS